MYRLKVVWELRVSETDELITTHGNKWIGNFVFKKQSEEVQEKIKKIVSKYYLFDEKDYNQWDIYIAVIGGEGITENELDINDDDIDFSTKEELAEADYNFEASPLYFIATIQREEYDSPADYYTIQKEYDYDKDSYVVASYKTFEEAENYCKENNISVNNIIPQIFGNEFVELRDI